MSLALVPAERADDLQREAVVEEVVDLLARAVLEDVGERDGRVPSGTGPKEEESER